MIEPALGMMGATAIAVLMAAALAAPVHLFVRNANEGLHGPPHQGHAHPTWPASPGAQLQLAQLPTPAQGNGLQRAHSTSHDQDERLQSMAMHVETVVEHLPRVGGVDDVKRLVHTAWWPPGNDKWEEAVGIVSRGVVFMTGMMEPQTPPSP